MISSISPERRMLEQLLQFTAARHNLIAGNIANIDTPGYLQKDLDVNRFYGMLHDAVQDGQPSLGSEDFDRITSDVQNPTNSILFHDGSNRSDRTTSQRSGKERADP